MKIALTGGTGLVGRFIAAEALAAGDHVKFLSRPDYQLGDDPVLDGCDALIHCAFQHAPGRYRGGEGDDPSGFKRANLDGSVTLFKAAKAAGVARVIFLSSRAVYDGYPPGTLLTEDLQPKPTTLYGDVKWQAEQALDALRGAGFCTANLRATGVYGPAPNHKWSGLFAAYLAGHPIDPRKSTELRGADLASAVRILLECPAGGTFNASDLVLDRHDLFARVAAITQSGHPLPARAENAVSVMSCTKLQALGWRPSGWAGLEEDLPKLLTECQGVNHS